MIAGPEIWLGMGVITPEMILSVRQDLALTADQESRMTSLSETAVEQGIPLEKQIRQEQKKLTRLLQRPETTQEEASAALIQLLDAEAALKQLRLKTLLSLRDMLTPEQQVKAAKLAPEKAEGQGAIETRFREKVKRLRKEVVSLGVPPTEALQKRGEAVELLVKQGGWQAAEEALDQLLVDSGLNKPQTNIAVDFSQYEPGDTDLESLLQRYGRVEKAVQDVVSISLVRQMLQGREALEKAKVEEDAVTVGRILTWAEQALQKAGHDL